MSDIERGPAFLHYLLPFFRGVGESGELYSFISAVEIASKDDRCLGIKANLTNGMATLDWATCWEIKTAFEEFKKVRDLTKMANRSFVHLKDFNAKQLYVASSIGSIYAPNSICMGIFNFGSLSFHFKDFLEMLGVRFVVTKTGKYKSVFDNLTESNLTEAERESKSKIYEGLEEEWVDHLSTKWSVQKEKIAGLLNRVVFAEELKEIGIIQDYYSDDPTGNSHLSVKFQIFFAYLPNLRHF